MMSSILTHVLQLLSIFTLLQLQCIGTEAYPITSKPIEWTAENWAWQAWAKQTSEEQSKGKGRKVTPKSIFETPYRNGCPPGHHADGNRCIPTVSIDPNELLNKQVLAIVGDFNIGSTNFEFDYGDEFGSAIADGLGFEAAYNTYDEPQKFSGGSLPLPSSFDNAGQLPTQDAPLKFNFFEQKLAGNENDTMPDSMSYDDEYGMSSGPSNLTTNLPDTKNITQMMVDLFWGQNITTASNSSSTNVLNNNSTITNVAAPNTDLITESSNILTSMAASGNTGRVESSEMPEETTDFSLADIDAISLSVALPMRHLTGTSITQNQEEITKNTPSIHKVSLHKGDTVVELITTASLSTQKKEEPLNKDEELTQLLKSDGFLPLFNGFMPSNLMTSSSPTSSSLSAVISSETNSQTLETTTNESVAQVKPKLVDNDKGGREKSDHTRSVTESFLLSADDLSGQENEFTTTTIEPDGTTSFQLDDTTIIEAFNPPTIELQELQGKPASGIELEEKQLQANNNVVVMVVDEKSKVQPVSEATIKPLQSIAALPDSHQFDIDMIIDGDVNIGDTAVDVTENNQFNYGTSSTTEIPTTTLPTSDNSHSEIHNESDRVSSVSYDLLENASHNNGGEGGETTSTNKNSAIVETTTSSSTTTVSNEELSNFEMQATTISFDMDKINTSQQSLITNADVAVNRNEHINDNDNDVGEIVFVVESHQNNNNNNNTKWQPPHTSVESGAVDDESFTNENIEIASKPETTTSATTTTATSDIISKRWSKVMPIFDKNTSPTATEQLVDETTLRIHEIMEGEQEKATMLEQSIKTVATETSTTITPIKEMVITSSSSISSSETRSSKNGNRRNSKIIRLDKYPLAASVNSLSESSKYILPPALMPLSVPTTSTPLRTTTFETGEDTSDVNDGETSSDSSSNASSDPFWWIPTGWRLDRHENFQGRPLLLRLWTTFTSNNHAKV